ncbi:hypothetical protein NMG60_11016422 [Bertholletia excelsa]
MPFWIVDSYNSKGGVPAPITNERLKQFIQQYDRNGDGKLSREELKQAFKSQGFYFCGRKAKKAIQHADHNHDNYISEEELNELLQYASLEWGFVVV